MIFIKAASKGNCLALSIASFEFLALTTSTEVSLPNFSTTSRKSVSSSTTIILAMAMVSWALSGSLFSSTSLA